MVIYPKEKQLLSIMCFFLNKLVNFWLHCVFVGEHELSLVATSKSYSLVEARRLLITVASLVAEHRPQGTQASIVAVQQLWLVDLVVVGHGPSWPHGIWNLHRPRIKPVSPGSSAHSLTDLILGKQNLLIDDSSHLTEMV